MKINHFLESVDRFIQCLRSSQKSIASAFKLEEPDIGYNLDVALQEHEPLSAGVIIFEIFFFDRIMPSVLVLLHKMVQKSIHIKV